MSQSYIGEIRMFGGNFAPAGWAFCDGQLLAIGENDALFSLIGTTYGGDGQKTFALPDLRGRVPVHQGNVGGEQVIIGQSDGVETVTLTTNQIPVHNHPLLASTTNATDTNPSGRLTATAQINIYQDPTGQPLVQLAPTAVQGAGGSQPHENVQPFLCISFIISLSGVFPTQG
ncbi:MAG: phage tail protein [Bryobacteraceae bacterium]